ncbi:MAG: MFS transporter, partial [Clostridia bacterium]|nr:MFS transporter [Clostridia bacterium]
MGKKQLANGKVSLGNKLAFACGDIFGGGSFNIINFLFTPFLTLVVGIPMVWLAPILLFTKIWDGFIDPIIGRITDGTTPGKFGKRRKFMLIFAPFVLVCLVLLFFPWNMVTDSVLLKSIFVVIIYMMYATAQSFVLIPYYSHASEMTPDFTERNNTNAVRLAFSIASSTICVAVPGMIASPSKGDQGKCYIVMAVIFGVIFMVSILITALFSREQIVTPAVKTKFSLKQFLRPLKVKTYRQYLGMQMCSSMAMAMMSSFFFTFCDFFIRRLSYQQVTISENLGRFPIATVAAAMMFVAQIVALPIYLKIIKAKSKRFAYITGCVVWMVVVAFMWLLPAETKIDVVNGSVQTVEGAPNWLIMVFGLLLGLGIGGTVFVPHSSFG